MREREPPFSLPDLPDKGPDILGGQPRYHLGDAVNVTCVSSDSLPAANLQWYINGEKADRHFLLHYHEETNYEGLRTAKLGLAFKVRKLWAGEKKFSSPRNSSPFPP